MLKRAQSRTITAITIVAVATLSVACTRTETGAPPGASTGSAARLAVTASVTSSAAHSAAPTATGKVARTPKSAEALPPAGKRAEFAAAMAEGRKHSLAKAWPQAVTAFEKAVAAQPANARAMADLGYVAGLAGDGAKATTWNAKALAVASDPVTLAQVHYNQGTVESGRKNTDIARAHFEKSLALRRNETVARALAALPPLTGATCESKTFSSVSALCTCISTAPDKRAAVGVDASEPLPLKCAEEKIGRAEGPQSNLFHTVRFESPESTREQPQLLVVEQAGLFRLVSELGTSYEPGAFGVHNESTADSVVTKQIGGKTVAYVTWRQNNIDFNMGGLQADEFSATYVTLCILDGRAKDICPLTIATDERTALTYPMEPEGPEMKADLEEMKKNSPPKENVVAATFTLDDDGTFRLQEIRGTRPELAKYKAGVKLW
jgi:hypothetical protein